MPGPENIIYSSVDGESQQQSHLANNDTTIYYSRIFETSLISRRNEVSLSAMTLLYQEVIKKFYRESKTLNDFEMKLVKFGYSIGLRLLELLNFRASIPQQSQQMINNAASTTKTSTSFLSSVTGASSTTATGTKPVGSTHKDATHEKTASDHRTQHHTGSTSSSTNLKSGSSAHANSVSATLITKMRRRDLKILDILQFIHGTVWSFLYNHVSSDLVKSSERDNEYMIIDNEPILTQFISFNPGSNGNASCDYFTCGIIKGYLESAGFPCDVTAHLVPLENFNQRTVYLIRFDKEVIERENLRYNN